MSIRQGINNSLLRPLGLPQLPVQTSAPSPLSSQPNNPPRVNPAWPSRKS
jgi:hypothetical protein